ncbi:cytochrome B [Idiomarina piscisalsi]|uniref:Cytochrome B n=1 Tax=Idiomarina piscisalsi TaxID=1096243 RepID=A0ABM6LSJ1_9GAMM|nr:cytochrome b/b6 domain-containing protein [Idiomarina piscisalsi]ASG65508.1 cytochrome B [Idiomarina piscisalsi]
MNSKYTPLSRTLHWLGALSIFTILTLGFMMVFADSREVKHYSEAAHIGVGFFVFFIVAWRIVLRFYQGFPESTTTVKDKLVRYLHYALLLTMLVLIVTGPLYLFTENDPLSVFGWFSVSMDLSGLPWLHEPSEEIHKVLGTYVLPVLVTLHIAGGVWHFYKEKD